MIHAAVITVDAYLEVMRERDEARAALLVLHHQHLEALESAVSFGAKYSREVEAHEATRRNLAEGQLLVGQSRRVQVRPPGGTPRRSRIGCRLNPSLVVLPSGAALVWPPVVCPQCKRIAAYVATTPHGTRCAPCAR